MEPLFDSVAPIPGSGFGEVDGHFGYRVYDGYIEYVDVDRWTGTNDRKCWSHQEFYDLFKSSTDDQMVVAVTSFLVKNKLVVDHDSV